MWVWFGILHMDERASEQISRFCDCDFTVNELRKRAYAGNEHIADRSIERIHWYEEWKHSMYLERCLSMQDKLGKIRKLSAHH